MIFTRHEESENCNSMELLKIIEKISPEIIFEELSYSNFDEVYKDKCLITLESNAIKKYLQIHDIEHIPVDTYNRPKDYQRDIDYMYNKVINNISVESYNLKGLLNNQISLANHNGFNYLNSNQNDDLFEKINFLKECILNSINDENLFRIACLHKEVMEKRENEIIDNIYNFSKEHVYNQAILFIGSGHRKSIIKKIEERKTQNKIEINWSLFNN